MTLRAKFVVPINLVLAAVVAASLAWEWSRQVEAGHRLLRTRLDEEARFVLAARVAFGVSPRFSAFLDGFCHAIDPATSPEHQVALLNPAGEVVASAAMHARRPLEPGRWAALGPGFRTHRVGGESILVRVADGDGWRVVLAESTRAVDSRVRENLGNLAGWFLGAGAVVIGAVNLLIRRTVLRPVGKISRAVRELEAGRLGVEIEHPNGDELGALARRFNVMSRTLAGHAREARRELETARKVQDQMLPPAALRLGGVEFAGRCVSKGMVGGDLFDVQLLHDGRVALLVADLSGHDVAAALHTAMLRAIAWREAEAAVSPGEVLAKLNERLGRNLPEEHFATAFLGYYDPGSGVLQYANAGHPPALLRRDEGPVVELGDTGPMLGVVADADYGDEVVEMPPGAWLAVFSDGLTETAARDGRLWGPSGAATILAQGAATPTAMLERVAEAAGRHRGGAPPQDDLTIVIAWVVADPVRVLGGAATPG